MSGLGEFEFDDMIQLQKQLQKMEDDWDSFLIACIKELAARLYAKVVMRTPVDTGELRRGWRIGEVQIRGKLIQVEIINPVEHALYVEYGHRTRDHKGWVEGKYMLTISEKELKDELPAFLERKLAAYIDLHMR